jgi:hypothetical protein
MLGALRTRLSGIAHSLLRSLLLDRLGCLLLGVLLLRLAFLSVLRALVTHG